MRVSTLIVVAVIAAILIAFPGTPAVAQQGIVTIDHVECLFARDTIVAAPKVRFLIRFTNNTPEKVDISNGWRVHTPDGANLDSVTIDTIGYFPSHQSTFASYFNMTFAVINDPTNWGFDDTVAVLGSGSQSLADKQLPVGFSDTVLAITAWTGNSAAQNDMKHLCIDTSFFQPGGEWMWVGRSLAEYHPTFVGTTGVPYVPGDGYCYVLYHVCDPITTSATQNSPLPTPMLSPACACSCCQGKTGDLNSDGYVNLGDLAGMVAYLTGTGYYPACFDEANVSYWGTVDLTDLSILVAYLTGLPVPLADCH